MSEVLKRFAGASFNKPFVRVDIFLAAMLARHNVSQVCVPSRNVVSSCAQGHSRTLDNKDSASDRGRGIARATRAGEASGSVQPDRANQGNGEAGTVEADAARCASGEPSSEHARTREDLGAEAEGATASTVGEEDASVSFRRCKRARHQ